MSPSKHVLYYGVDKEPANPSVLRAGPVTVQFEENAIRYVRIGKMEILRMVYAAVRDHNWGTVLGEISDLSIQDNPDSFVVSFKSTHRQADIDFVWTGTITGGVDGTISFEFDGVANSTFRRNRIGFCVLHQMECAGVNCLVEHIDGSVTGSIFPQSISPHQPFFDIRVVTHDVNPDLKVRVLMEGDTFEMEDQRNWTDASYKTYCTPLGLPFPVTVNQGDRIQQKITVSLEGAVPEANEQTDGITFSFQDESLTMPSIGLGIGSHGEALTSRQIERLKMLNLSHLRCDLKLWQDDWQQQLEDTIAQVAALNVQLELAIHVSDDAEGELQALLRQLEATFVPLARIFVFHQNEKSTTAKWVQLTKQVLADLNVSIGTGTKYFFTELNRERPPVDEMDFAVYSLNPQVHAFDNTSLTETLSAQAVTVQTARTFCRGKRIVVSPVTLKMLDNPNATGEAIKPPPGELPPEVDERQMSLYGAAWTLGSIKYLSESQVESITYHETTGWLGVMATETGSPLPEKFVDIPDAVYPVWHVFNAIGEFGGDVIRSKSTAPLTVDGLVMCKDNQLRVLLANYSPQVQTIRVTGFAGDVSLKQLNADNAEDAMRDPLVFRNLSGNSIQSGATIELQPYAFAQLDGLAT